MLFTAEYRSFMAFIFCGERKTAEKSFTKENVMSKSISIEQSHNVISVLINNVDWSKQDGKILQEIIRKPREAGAQFTIFLKNGAKIIGESKIIPIDRSKPFKPTEFIGKGWTVIEEDKRSLALTEVDLSKIYLKTCLKKDEFQIKGKERLKRLKKAGYIRLDAKIFQTLLENKHLIPETLKEKIDGNIPLIFFDGTILRSPNGTRYVLSLYWDGAQWDWPGRWFVSCGCHVIYPSAVLVSS